MMGKHGVCEHDATRSILHEATPWTSTRKVTLALFCIEAVQHEMGVTVLRWVLHTAPLY